MAEINVGQISEALNNKADLDLNNTNPFADYVIEYQRPTSENNYTWYRLYKSGWVEQGGETTSASITISLPKEMASSNYTVMATILTTSTSTNYYATKISSRTTTGFTITGNTIGCMWEVKGFAAQS